MIEHVDVFDDVTSYAEVIKQAGLREISIVVPLLREPAVDVRNSTHQGNPAKVLIELAGSADLLVVGSRGHGGFAGMLLGSVSQHLVAHAALVLLVMAYVTRRWAFANAAS